MSEPNKHLAIPDAWRRLRELTPARIALGRSGGSIPTGEWLDFRLAHARARDAVQAEFRPEELSRQLTSLGLPPKCLTSGAHDRAEFLKRPDLGRKLSTASRDQLLAAAPAEAAGDKASALQSPDLAIIVSDGLSALAAERQVLPLLKAWLPIIAAGGWRLAPASVVSFGRVAIEDEIGELLRARVAVILLGERPGLGSPDSLSAYLVYAPRIGRTDAERNCVSNIRPQGLPPETAALKLHYLVGEALNRQLSGVNLKDESLSLGQTPPGDAPIRPLPSGEGRG
ncbi:MAG TPA: ethanolamine ammonia-lyase subunit EutC [Pirellulales bacterium]|jgi:ethanolamine ammonia-lyase small subunit